MIDFEESDIEFIKNMIEDLGFEEAWKVYAKFNLYSQMFGISYLIKKEDGSYEVIEQKWSE